MGYVGFFCCWVLAGTLLVAAAAKLREFDDFAASLVALRLVGRGRGFPLAAAVTAAEFTVAALCLWPASALWGLGLAAVLMVAFVWVAATAGRRGTVVPCRCFGSAGAPLGRRHVWRNGLLLGLALAGLPAALVPGAVSTGGLLLTLVPAVVAIALVIHIDDITDLVLPTAPNHSIRR